MSILILTGHLLIGGIIPHGGLIGVTTIRGSGIPCRIGIVGTIVPGIVLSIILHGIMIRTGLTGMVIIQLFP